MKTATESHDEFVSKLNILLRDIKQAAESQYKYNLNNNIPAGIAGITLDNAAENAVESGLINAIGKMIKWDTDEATKLAFEILQDNNCSIATEFHNKYIGDGGYGN